MTPRWKRRLTVVGLALASSLGMLFAAAPAYASNGCNGDMCIDITPTGTFYTAKITYTGRVPSDKNFGLITQYNGGIWSPPITAASYTWTQLSIAKGKVCATIRWVRSKDGPPGYPCITLR